MFTNFQNKAIGFDVGTLVSSAQKKCFQRRSLLQGRSLLQFPVSEIMTETNKNRKNKTHPTASEIIPSKNQKLYIITLYHNQYSSKINMGE